MEISDITRSEQSTIQHHNSSTDSQQSDSESPSLEMTVVLNEQNPYWANDTLRCASNAEMSPGGKARKDFKFQVIHLNAGPRWFIFPSNKAEKVTELPQAPTNGSSDQENQRENPSVRRSMLHMSRRKVSNELNKAPPTNNDIFEDNLCNATATNYRADAPMSEPTTRRINSKPMCQPDSPINCRFNITKASLSVSPPSTSSDYSTFSNQSTLSSQSDTFQILSVVKNTDEDEEETIEEMPMVKDIPQPTILISNVDGKSRV